MDTADSFSYSQHPHSVLSGLKRLYRDVRTAPRDLADHILTITSVMEPPFDPWLVASRLGVRIVRTPIEAQAQLTWNGTEWLIFVRQEKRPRQWHSRAREAFAIAHELGHYALRTRFVEYWPDFVFVIDDFDEERFCDRFAAELLMPKRCFGVELRQRGLLPSTLLSLADKYRVSRQASLKRAIELTEPRVNAVIWNREADLWRIHWASSPSLSRAILCNSGRTPVERAYIDGGEEAGIIEVLIDARRQRSSSVAFRPPGSTHVICLLGAVGFWPPEWLKVRLESASRTQSRTLEESPSLRLAKPGLRPQPAKPRYSSDLLAQCER